MPEQNNTDKFKQYHQVAVEMANAELAEDGCLCLRVVGSSMLPTLRSGDVVQVEPVLPENVEIGDLLAVQREGEIFTHRLVAVREQRWITKGDAIPYADPSCGWESILGRVTHLEQDGETVLINERVGRRLATIGKWEAQLFGNLRKIIKQDTLKSQTTRPNLVHRLTRLPFRFLTWVLYKLG